MTPNLPGVQGPGVQVTPPTVAAPTVDAGAVAATPDEALRMLSMQTGMTPQSPHVRGDEPTVPARWRDEEMAILPGEPPYDARRRKIMLVMLLGFVFFASLASMIFWLRPVPRPILVALWYPENAKSPWRPPFAIQDKQSLVDGGFFPRVNSNLTSLSACRPQDHLVVYLSGLARCDDQGRLGILTIEAEGSGTGQYRPLRDFLKALEESPSRHKLLILDIAWPRRDLDSFVLAEDVSQHIEAELEAVPDPTRFVLSSCSPGQVSLASEELGRSVFNYYLEEGLRGWADLEQGKGEVRGLVTVKELAEFTRTRVDRWARLHQNVRQTPVLYGDGPDFPLVSLSQNTPQPMPVPRGARAYPDWLRDAWKVRDAWLAESRFERLPWLVRELEETVHRAEMRWKRGSDEERLKADLERDLARLESVYLSVSKDGRPQPQSLAQAYERGQRADPALNEPLRDYVRKAEEIRRQSTNPVQAEKDFVKLAQDFVDTHKKQADFAVLSALFQNLADDPFPQPSKIIALERLRLLREPEPRFRETLAIHRLAQLATTIPTEQWQARTVQRYLELTRLGEAVTSNSLAFPWIEHGLASASPLREIGETLLFATGYAPVVEADKALSQAVLSFEALRSRQDAVENAHRVMWLAYMVLPSGPALLDHQPSLESSWTDAVRCTQEMQKLLERPAPGPIDREFFEEVRYKTGLLRNALDGYLRPWSPESLADLEYRSRRSDAGFLQVVEMEGIQTAPFLTAERRVALWKATRDLDKKLVQALVEKDAEEGRRWDVGGPPSLEGDATRWRKDVVAKIESRSAHALTLLHLASMDPDNRKRLEEDAAKLRGNGMPKASDTGRLNHDLRHAWDFDLPRRFDRLPDGTRAEILARVLGFSPRWGPHEERLARAAIPEEQRRWSALGAFLASEYRQLSLESDAPAFLSRAAFAFRDLWKPSDMPARLLSNASTLNLNFANRILTSKIDLNVLSTEDKLPPIEVNVLQPNQEWLDVAPHLEGLAKAAVKPGRSNVAIDVPLTVVLRPDAEFSRAPRPLGFLVQFRSGNWVSHHKVTLPHLPTPDRLEVILSADAKSPSNPFGDLRLRPLLTRQAYFLYLRNGSERPRQVTVEARAGDIIVPGGVISLTIPPKQTVRIPFPGVPASKEMKSGPDGKADATKESLELPELMGPLHVRVLDKDQGGEVVVLRDIRVAIASPRELTRVASIRFEPNPMGKNRLSVDLKASHSGLNPACQVELVLPKDRIPGLRSVADGVFRGQVAPGAEGTTLFAEGFKFDPAADEEGIVYLTVDGVERAFIFQTTFARLGESTVPREDISPALRVKADRYFQTNGTIQGLVEADNAPAEAKLTVEVGRQTADGFVADLQRPQSPARERRVGMRIRPADGALEFDAVLRDWHFAFEKVPIRGERVLRVRLVDAQNRDVAPPVNHSIIIDDQAPQRVNFVELPKAVKKGTMLTVRAIAFDQGTGIRDAIFFLGAAGDNKLPPAQVKGRPVEDEKGMWIAELQIPDAASKEPVTVGVQFTNFVGLSTVATGKIDVVDFDPAKTAPASIVGEVWEGALRQANLTVVLQDEKGNKVREAKTGDRGGFTFENVSPGRYRVLVVKPSSRRVAERTLTLRPGTAESVRLDLLLQ